MAIDNTPPRLKLIITIAAITVVTLVSIDFALRSYYNFMTEQAQKEKLAEPKELAAHRAAVDSALKGSAVDQAMKDFAKGTRSELVTPKPSDDMGPMTGWTKLPKPLPVAPAKADHPSPPATTATPEKKPATPPAPEKKPATPPTKPAPAPGAPH